MFIKTILFYAEKGISVLHMLSTCFNIVPPSLTLLLFLTCWDWGSPGDRSCQKLFRLYEIIWFSWSEKWGSWIRWNYRLFQGWAFQLANSHQHLPASLLAEAEKTSKGEENHLLPGASRGPGRQSTGSLGYSSTLTPAPPLSQDLTC